MTVAVGERIRQRRLASRRSLRSVAAAAGISPSLLSQVETGNVEPSVRSLHAIVEALGLSIDSLLDSEPRRRRRSDEAQGPALQRAADNPRIAMENGVTWQRLAVANPGDGVAPLLVTYAAGGASSVDGDHSRHEGTEYGYVLSGALTLKLGFDSYVLRAGDSVCFDSSRPHIYVNETEEVAQGLWLVLGPAGTSAEQPTSVRNPNDALIALQSFGSPPSTMT